MKIVCYETRDRDYYINYCVEDDHESYVKDVLPTKFTTQSQYIGFLRQIQKLDVLPCKIDDIFAEGRKRVFLLWKTTKTLQKRKKNYLITTHLTVRHSVC